MNTKTMKLLVAFLIGAAAAPALAGEAHLRRQEVRTLATEDAFGLPNVGYEYFFGEQANLGVWARLVTLDERRRGRGVQRVVEKRGLGFGVVGHVSGEGGAILPVGMGLAALERNAARRRIPVRLGRGREDLRSRDRS